MTAVIAKGRRTSGTGSWVIRDADTGRLTRKEVNQITAKVTTKEEAIQFLKGSGFLTPAGKVAPKFRSSKTK